MDKHYFIEFIRSNGQTEEIVLLYRVSDLINVFSIFLIYCHPLNRRFSSLFTLKYVGGVDRTTDIFRQNYSTLRVFQPNKRIKW